MSNWNFLFKTAYRDSRKHRLKLLMFMSSIVLGVAALVAINSFNYNLVADIDKQSASLLGADMVISANKKANENVQTLLDSIPGESSVEVQMFSMAFIQKAEQTQFVQVRGLEGDFPYYGQLMTTPESAGQDFRTGNGALAEEALMIQYDLEINDSIKIGDVTFPIIGRLRSAIGGTGITSGVAPSVYISMSNMDRTNLVRPGSLVDYSYIRKLPKGFDADKWKDDNRIEFRKENFRVETINDRKRSLNRAFSSLNYFLNLVALVSLLLGCIGVASSVFIYVRSKLSSVAIFRCLGMSGRDALWIFLIQILGLGFLSVVVGVLLGTAVQLLLPILLNDFLPVTVETSLSYKAILEGTVIGLLVTSLFALIPLIKVRKVSPLRTLRSGIEEDVEGRDFLSYVLYLIIAISMFGFLWVMTGDWMSAGFFLIGIVAAFLVIYLVSKFVMWFVQKFFPRKWNFVWRQGISNLYRPNNQTLTLLSSIGLGTAVLSTLFIVQGLILSNVSSMDAGSQPNAILYGIEPSQADSVAQITKEFDMPVLSRVPIVTMKMDSWKGRTKKEWMEDTTARVSRWAANRELRVSYRDTLSNTEKLLEGEFIGTHNPDSDSIFISLDKGYAEGLNVDLGDEIIFNVQGTRMTTYVSSFREIDFRNMDARFFILFPTGVLEEAPHFEVLITKTKTGQSIADYRNRVVQSFPNVSVVDLGMILETVNEILGKVSYVVQFLAGFSILTGLIVLLSSLLLSKFQRVKESVLLRTLGASRRQIFQISFIEYFLLGALSAFTGIILSIIGSYLITRFQLDIEYALPWLSLLLVFIVVTGLTVLIGILNSREVLNKPPLEVLRNELS